MPDLVPSTEDPNVIANEALDVYAMRFGTVTTTYTHPTGPVKETKVTAAFMGRTGKDNAKRNVLILGAVQLAATVGMLIDAANHMGDDYSTELDKVLNGG